jgi:hypothetical protein
MPTQDTRLAERPPLVDTLASNLAAVSDGAWKPLRRRQPITVSLESDPATPFSGTAQLIVTLRTGTPASTDHSGYSIHTFTAPGSFVIDAAWEHVKLRVTAYTSGVISHAGLAAP